jgi:uncharacterized protein (TIGR01244 family)
MLPALLLTALLAVAPETATAPPPQPSTKVNEVIPGKVYTSGIMTYETLTNLKKMGVGTVLHLRPEKEAPSLPATERVAVEGMGLAYRHAPVTPQTEDEEFDGFRKAMKTVDFTKGAIMVHCFNGNRASASLLTYWVLDQKMPMDQAIALAKKGGLSMVKVENAARFYISRNGGPAYVEQEAPKPAAVAKS